MKTYFFAIFVLFSVVFSVPFLFASDEEKSSKICTMEYAPVCGRPEVNCPAGAECMMPLPKTYSNSCMLESENATFLYDGECKHDKPSLPAETATKKYVGNTQDCQMIKYRCETGWNYFGDEIGCGCVKSSVLSEKVQTKVQNTLDVFISTLKEKNLSTSEIYEMLQKVSLRLDNLSQQEKYFQNEKYMEIIQYIQSILEEKIQEYSQQ